MPRQNSSGGKERLGRITKTGDRYIRRLLMIGATGLIRYKRKNVPGGLDWVTRLLATKPVRLVTVALANKDGPHRLGGPGQGRSLSRDRCRGGVSRACNAMVSGPPPPDSGAVACVGPLPHSDQWPEPVERDRLRG